MITHLNDQERHVLDLQTYISAIQELRVWVDKHRKVFHNYPDSVAALDALESKLDSMIDKVLTSK